MKILQKDNSKLLLLTLLLVFTSLLSAQSFTGTWALTATNSVTTSGFATSSTAAIGSGLTAPVYSGTTGMTPGGWATTIVNPNSLDATEYCEYSMAPNSGYSMTISSFTGQHSVSNSTWDMAAYYSLDNFATAGVQIGNNITGFTATTSTTFSFTGLSIVVPATKTVKIRVYAWLTTALGILTTGSYSNKNIVISGTTCVLPVISVQPLTQTICSNTSLNLSVSSTGGTSFQWKKNGTIISGATTASYSIGSATTSDAGNYSVDITNSCGTVISTAATVTVQSVPTSGSIGTAQTICYNATPSGLTNTTLGTGGGTISYVWESNTNLVVPSWSAISGQVSASYAPGLLTTTTQYRRKTISTVNGVACESLPTVSIQVTVHLNFTTGAINTVGESICYNGDPSVIVSATSASGGDNSITYKWQANGVDIASSNSATYDAPTGLTTATTYTRYAKDATCNTTFSLSTGSWTVTVNSLSVGGIVATNQTICSGKQPANLILSGNTGLVVKWQSSSNVGFTSPTDIISSSTTLTGATIGNLTSNTYFRAVVQSGVCASANSASVLISIGGTSLWNGTSWDVTPTGLTSLVFNGGYSSVANIAGCICTVNSGNVVINSSNTMTLEGAVTVNGGTLTFENNANLLQNSTVSNSGNVIIKRASSALKRLDYTLWSSPVVNQNLLAFSPNTLTNRFYTYGVSSNLYEVVLSPSVSNFSIGKGYLIRMPNTHPISDPTVWNSVFTGVPTNGTVTVSILDGGSTTTRFNAVGNPYPSAIDVTSFLSGNSSNIEGTLWFWRKTNNTNNPVSYSTCTSVGCTLNNSHIYTATSSISTGQGFIVKAKAGASSLTFNNTMRSSTNVNDFFKTTTVGVNRFWLELTNSVGVNFGQKLIAYLPETTLGYDDGFDGLFLLESNTRLTSIVDNRELVIQARPAFEVTDVVPLYFATDATNTYTISLQDSEGVFTIGQAVWLRDTLTQTLHNLSDSAYSFYSTAGIFDTRFEILYQNLLGVDSPILVNSSTVFQSDVNELTLITKNNVDSVTIYNLTGQQLYTQNNTSGSTQLIFKNLPRNELLLVSVKYSDGSGSVAKSILK